MAKRSRQRDPVNDTPVRTSRSTPRTSRRSPARKAREQTFLERYSGLLIVGLGAAGVLVIFFFLFQGGARGAYACESLLSPGPVESVTPRPVTPSPDLSPSPSPAASPDPDTSPDPDASPGPDATPSPADSPSPQPSPTASPSPQPDPTPRLGFTTPNLGQLHVRDPGQTIVYGFCPPTSGDHWSIANVGPIRPGFYPQNEERPPGGWVHNLEHGYVVALYRCSSDDDCPSEVELDLLRRFTEEAPGSTFNPACSSMVIAARFDEMSTPYAMVAWGRALLMDEFDLDTALTFAEQWIDHELVPERGVC